MKKVLFTAIATTAAAADFKGASTMQHAAQSSLNYSEAPADHFSGPARFALFPAIDESRDGWAIVDFGPGTVNSWHSHSKGQYLIITQGSGLVQQWGQPVQQVRKGDVVWFPPEVKHWHGAAPGQTMSHIAIAPEQADNKTTWFEPVDPQSLASFAGQADGSVKQTTALTERQLALVPIAALATAGKIDQLKGALEQALAAGLTVNEIREIFTHQQAYAGFPRALNGLTAFNELLKERAGRGLKDPEGKGAAPPDPEANYGRGVQTLIDIGAPGAAEGVLFASEGMDYALKANLFGYLFSRGVLSHVDREMVVIATIAALGDGVESQLSGHLKNTHSLGVSAADLRKIIAALKTADGESGARAQQALDGLQLQ